MGERSRMTGLVAPIIFAVSFLILAPLSLQMRALFDSDSYYHLAVARLYAEEGITARPPWGRFSLISDGGDKEFLFHLVLVPFVAAMDPPTGGRIALAVIHAAVITIVATTAVKAIGWPGLLLPLWMYVAVPPFLSRVPRLRPELLALLIILAAVMLWPRRTPLLVGTLAFLFTQTYTAFHVFAGLCYIWLAYEWWSSRQRPHLALLIAPLAGSALGFVARPHFIGYARIWYAQNVMFFQHKSHLDVGEEIFAPDLRFLILCIPWILGLIALAAVAMDRETSDRRLVVGAAAAIVFLVLFVFMARMITYVVPLVTLVAIMRLRRGMDLKRKLTVAAILAAGITAGVAQMLKATVFVPTWIFSRAAAPEEAWQAMGTRIPAGAKIATSWGLADLFAYWAPHGRYLNLLDPIFMFAPYPERQVSWQRITAGAEPDVARAVASSLDSDFLLINPLRVSSSLLSRLPSDPRFSDIAPGLFVLREPAEGTFVLDWVTEGGLPYPRAGDERARRFEGFVSLERFGGRQCATLGRDEPPNAKTSSWEFAPYARAVLRIDGRPIVETRGTPGAILGRGFSFQLPPSETPRRFEVVACKASDGTGGFYLVRRDNI